MVLGDHRPRFRRDVTVNSSSCECASAARVLDIRLGRGHHPCPFAMPCPAPHRRAGREILKFARVFPYFKGFMDEPHGGLFFFLPPFPSPYPLFPFLTRATIRLGAWQTLKRHTTHPIWNRSRT